MSKSEQLVKLYRGLAEIPALLGARLFKGNIVQSVWSQRNLERGKTTKFAKTHLRDGDGPFTELFPVDISSESLSSISPSEKFRAVLRDVESKDTSSQFLEVWQNNNLIRSLDLTSLDVHGKVYTDGEFASLEWSPDEKKILYVAERKEPKKEPINKRRKKKDTKDQGENDDYFKSEEFRQDWGEQLVGKISSVFAWYDLDLDEVVMRLGVPENICVAQLQWSPDGSQIVGIAYKTEPRKLGLIYCSNRPSTIFQYKLDDDTYYEFALEDKSVKSPRFCPDKKSLIWLQASAGGPHHSCMSLVQSVYPFNEHTKSTIVIDTVQTEITTTNGKPFHGLYNTSFPKRCWSKDGRLLLHTNQKNTVNSYVVDIENKLVTELEFQNGSQLILDVSNDTILADRRNFLSQDTLVIAKLPEKGKESTIEWTNVTENGPLEGLSCNKVEYLNLEQQSNDTIKTFSAIYIGPKTAGESSIPLIVWPHGGPHSAYSNNLSLEVSMFLSLGYAVLMINYRGSIGAGQASVRYLLGRVGSADVSDCILATDVALSQYKCLDKNRIALVGGSHGGFLVTHLSGQYPEKFKAVVARNPVIDIASMSVVSDIPDWCYVECGKEYTQKGEVDGEFFLKMRKSSPIQYAHQVKAPTLLQIGLKDLRVPPSQGTEWFHRLKANGVTVKMNVYDDNHPLGTVPNEMDNIISTSMWLSEHLGD